MHVSTETIQQMRDGRVRDRLWLSFAPDSVQAVNEQMISLLGELLQYRDAEAAAESEEIDQEHVMRKRDRDSYNAGYEAAAAIARPLIEIIGQKQAARAIGDELERRGESVGYAYPPSTIPLFPVPDQAGRL